MKTFYVRNNNCKLLEFSKQHSFNLDHIEECLITANKEFKKAIAIRHRYDPANFIPLRNISGGVGESFTKMLVERDSGTSMIVNPHEDGYPDILPLVKESRDWIQTPTRKDFTQGGFDVKSKYVDNASKIDVGAASHHIKTKSIFNIIWAFEEKSPFIVAICYTNKLDESDWGTPAKVNLSSKTTPSCSLKKSGKIKLRRNWMFVHKDFINRVQSKQDWIGL